LVLAQPVLSSERYNSIGVSIPHWFSLNWEQAESKDDEKDSFPSHIGSRSTGREKFVYTEKGEVSIPHWFSLNP